jgi:hypothetical protein
MQHRLFWAEIEFQYIPYILPRQYIAIQYSIYVFLSVANMLGTLKSLIRSIWRSCVRPEVITNVTKATFLLLSEWRRMTLT